jgi:hypothetical protein
MDELRHDSAACKKQFLSVSIGFYQSKEFTH